MPAPHRGRRDRRRTVTGRVLTGDRPTGGLHLGHYFGTLANRVRLQQQGCELFVVVADYQVITDRDRPVDLPERRASMVLDYLACGIDADSSTIFAHSAVPALNQLLVPFLSLVSTGELDRNPTVKEEIRTAGRSSVSGLMLTYPVHQAADILFCKAELVPVGKDQLPHLELTRAIARRFNERYGPVFGLPEGLLGATGTLLGLDGRKMSKSLGNGIALSDGPDEVAAKIRAARTDSERRISYQPETPARGGQPAHPGRAVPGGGSGAGRRADRRRGSRRTQAGGHRLGERAAGPDPGQAGRLRPAPTPSGSCAAAPSGPGRSPTAPWPR